MGSEDESNATSDDKPRDAVKRQSKVRDIFTDRIVGVVSGAFVPVVLLLIPLVNKHLDNSKEIQELQIKTQIQNEEAYNKRVQVVTGALVSAQVQLQTLGQQLSEAIDRLAVVNAKLLKCQAGKMK